jgi:hypothetical protein
VGEKTVCVGLISRMAKVFFHNDLLDYTGLTSRPYRGRYRTVQRELFFFPFFFVQPHVISLSGHAEPYWSKTRFMHRSAQTALLQHIFLLDGRAELFYLAHPLKLDSLVIV